MCGIRYAVVVGVLLIVTLLTMLSLGFFPDHTLNAPPPCLTEQTIIGASGISLGKVLGPRSVAA